MNKDKIVELLESRDLSENELGMGMLRQLTLGECHVLLKGINHHEFAYKFPNGNLMDFYICTMFDAPVAMLRGLIRDGGVSYYRLGEFVGKFSDSPAIPDRYLMLPDSMTGKIGSEATLWMSRVLRVEWHSGDTPIWRIRRNG